VAELPERGAGSPPNTHPGPEKRLRSARLLQEKKFRKLSSRTTTNETNEVFIVDVYALELRRPPKGSFPQQARNNHLKWSKRE
jgi:hypothetical protein